MGFTVPPTLKEVMEKCREKGEIVYTKEEHDALLQAIGKKPIKEMPTEATETAQKPFDGFDWDKDMEEAYKTD